MDVLGDREKALTKARVLLFVGERSRYGAAHIEPLFQHFEVVGCVFADDARWKRFQEQVHGPVRPRWRDRVHAGRSPVLRVESSQWTTHDVHDPALVETLGRFHAEYCISAAYPQIFRKAILELTPGGVINFHPSALPEFRGAHPHFWTVATDAVRTGVTAHRMTEAIDEGDIYVQRTFDCKGMNYNELYAHLVEETPPLVADLASAIRERRPLTKQDSSAASLFFGDRELDHRLCWENRRVQQILALVRTQRAFTSWRGHRFGVVSAEDAGPQKGFLAGRPGVVLAVDAKGVVVAAVEGAVRLKTVRWKGVSWEASWLGRLGIRMGDSLV